MAAKAKFRKSGNGEKTADKSTVGERRTTCCRKGIVALDAYFTWADTWVPSAEKPFATIIKKIKVFYSYILNTKSFFLSYWPD